MIEALFDTLITEPFYLLTQYTGYVLLYILVILGLIALGIMLWHINSRRDDMVFTVTLESLGEQSEKIRALLTSMKATKREVTYALLLMEEILVRLHESSQEAVTARVRRFFGNVSISLVSYGEAYNPFASLESWDTESENYLRDMIFRAHKNDLSYTRRNGRNVVVLQAHRGESRAMYVTFAAMLFGCVIGFGMKWLPSEVSKFISENILSTVQTLFFNGIFLMLSPVVFFSVGASISNLSGGNEIGRIGGKVLGSFLLTTVISILIGFGISAILFGKNMPPLPENLMALPEGMQQSADVSVSALLLSVVPGNFVRPLLENNMLQVIFIAVLAGLSMLALGEKVEGLRSLFNEANDLCLKMMSMIIFFMPLVAFTSMALLVHASDAATLLVVLKYLLALVIGSAALFVVYMLIILVVGHISPLPYFKKAAVYFLTPFMIPSSSACIPLTIDFCKKKLGVSDKISSFAIPLGATVNMNGFGMSIILATVLLARMYGVELDLADCIKIGVMMLLLAVGAPGVPNSGLVVVATLLSAVHVPIATLGFLLGVWNIIDRIQTSCNVNGDIATSVIVAKSEGELDEKVYAS